MHTLVSSVHWVMREYGEHRLVQLKRTSEPFESNLDIAIEADRILPNLRSEYSNFGIVVDMRGAPLRADPQFEGAMRRLRGAIAESFARVAVLLRSQTGMLQVHRLTREDRTRTFATLSETAAFEFAKGLATVPANDRRAVAHDPKRKSSADPIEEALHWARDLEEWAIVREKVISKLDIRSARRARGLAHELRRTAEIAYDMLEQKGDREGRDEAIVAQISPLLEELAALRIEAVELMLGAAPVPQQAFRFVPSPHDADDRAARPRPIDAPKRSPSRLEQMVRALDDSAEDVERTGPRRIDDPHRRATAEVSRTRLSAEPGNERPTAAPKSPPRPVFLAETTRPPKKER